jgi:hypothetical protein
VTAGIIRKKKLKASDALNGIVDDDGANDGDEDEDDEGDEEALDDEEEEEEDNDYEDNYFDNGEDDGGDDAGGGDDGKLARARRVCGVRRGARLTVVGAGLQMEEHLTSWRRRVVVTLGLIPMMRWCVCVAVDVVKREDWGRRGGKVE